MALRDSDVEPGAHLAAHPEILYDPIYELGRRRSWPFARSLSRRSSFFDPRVSLSVFLFLGNDALERVLGVRNDARDSARTIASIVFSKTAV